MNVMMVETGGWGGLAHYAWNLCQALAEAGVKVTLLTNRLYELRGLPRGFAVEAKLDGQAGFLINAWLVARLVQRLKPDVIHVQSPLSTRFDTLLWPWVRRKTPLVFTAHNVRRHERDDRHHRHQWAWYRQAEAVVVHTKESVDEVRAAVGDHVRIVVIHHGDYTFFADNMHTAVADARRGLDLPVEAQIILAFGAIRPYKGLKDLIGMMPEIRRRCPTAELVIAGPLLIGDGRDYRAAIAQAKAEKYVRFRPEYVPFDQVGLYFRAADVAVYNYEDITDSGALRIACSQRVPVVATAVGGFREFLTDKVSGRLVPTRDPSALAAAVCDVLQDPVKARIMADAALEVSRQQWPWSASARATVRLYEAVCDGRSR
jgi:glycosyltransferase involved in cell wall biosynthesis